MSDNNEIVIELKGIVDTEDAQNQLSTLKQNVSAAKEEVFKMRDAFSEMPHFGQLLNNSLERTGIVADNAIKKLDVLAGGSFGSQQEQDDLVSRAQSSLRDFGFQRSMQNEDNFFNVNSARVWAKKLDRTVQQELDDITPQLTQIIRSKISAIAKNGFNFQFSDIASMASEITKNIHGDRDRKTSSVIGSIKHASSDDLNSYMSYLIANTVAPMYLDEYSLKRYGSRASSNKIWFDMSPENVVPDAFKESWRNKKYQRASGYSKPESVLNPAATALLNEVFATSPSAVRAGLDSGLLSRASNGVLQRTHLIDEKMLEDFYESMYVDTVQKTKGLGVNRIEDIYSKDVASKIAKRMSSGNTGRTWEALGRLSELRSEAYWMDRSNVYDRTPLQIPFEVRPELQMYSTKKYAPFSTVAGRKDHPEFSSISESQNTRKLGLQNRGNYADVSDIVSLLSLEGYDEDNEEHVAQLKSILKKGYKVGKTRMMVQSIHRGTDGIVARLVAQKAMREVDEAESSFAEEMGLRGSYWGGYQNEVIDQLAKDGKLSKVIFGKYQDSLNKAWTPSAQLGLNFDGKKIAIIDTEANGRDVADGIGFMSEDILPYSIQSRGAIGHKGTIRRLPGESLRSFAIRSGAARWNPNKQASDGTMGDYEWMQRGLGGDLFDIIDYHGFVSASTIKDKNAYINADGTKMSAEKSSQVFTERLKRDGLGAVTIFDEDGTASDNVGVQMMSFMKLSPELANNQLTGLIERMRELDTEEGQLKYVFPDPSSSWISRAVNNGEEGRALLQTEQARNQVDAYRNSLIRKAMSGIFVDYGNNKADSITNVEIADSPLSIFARMGQINDETKKYLRDAIKEQLGKEYSDSEFEDLLQLRGMNAIDFGKIDEDTLAYLRSPTGYANMVVANNRAKEYKVMYDALGKRKVAGFAEMSSFADTGGVALSSEIMNILQGADEDGDKVKRLTGIYKDMIARTVETVKTVSESDADIGFIPDDAPISEKDLKNKTAETTYVSNLQKESKSMGGGSAAARGVQVDLSKAGNYDYIKGAIQGQNIYNLLGTQGKKPGSATNTSYAINAMKLGKEYTKFTEGFNKLLALDQDMYDENKKVIADHPDVFFDEDTGLAINMRALKNLDTQHINLPSVYMDNALMANTLSRGLNENGLLETNQIDAIGRAMTAMYQYDPDRLAGAGENTVKLAKIMDSLRVQHAKGERFALEKNEENGLRSLYVAAMGEIHKEAKNREIHGRGSVLLDDGTTMNKNAYIESRARAYGLNIADNYLNNFGFTRRNLEIRFGQHAFDDIHNSANVALPIEIPDEATAEPAKPKRVIKGIKKRNAASEPIVEIPEEENKSTPTSVKEIPGIKRYTIRDGNLHSEIVNPDGIFDGRNAIMEYNPELPLISQLQVLQDANAQRAAIDNFLERSNEYRSSFNKDIFRDRERTDAENYYGRATYFRNLTDSDAEALLATIKDPATRQMIENTRADIQSGYVSATSKWSSNYNTSQLEALKKAASGVGDEFAAQEAKLRSFDQRIVNINSNIESFINSRDALGGLTHEENQQVNEMRRQKNEAEEYKAQAIQKLKDETGESYFDKLYSIQETVIGKALSPTQRVDLQINKNRRNIEGTLDGLKNLSEEDIDKYFNRGEYDDIVRNYEAALNIVNSNAYRNQLLRKHRYQAQRVETREKMQSLQQNQYIKQLERSSENDAFRETLDRTGLSNTAIGQNMLRNRERYNYYVSRHDNAQQRIAEENAYIDEQRNIKKTSTDEAERGLATKNIQEASNRLREYYKELDRAKAGMDEFSGATGKMRVGLDTISQSMSRCAAQFGRQMFHRAVQEAKQFVIDYDTAMTEIQMVTLKTDEEIAALGDSLIDTASSLRIGISDVTSAATSLYRQGLSDEQVNTRLSDVSKFAVTANVGTEDAIKLITVSMNSGMVSNSTEAMDVISALSDNAATDAKQITKGLQKSIPAAQALGVTYPELVAMIAAITSKTQLSGSVAGTAMRNIMSRISRFGDGSSTYASQIQTLQNNGVQFYENDGTMRNPTVILSDIGNLWEGFNDHQKNAISYALGGTEQFSNVSALMQAFSEKDANGITLIDQYLNIARNSDGITDQKYSHYVDNLTASITNLKNSFDGLIESAEVTDFIKTFIDWIAGGIKGIAEFNEETNGLLTSLISVATALAALITLVTHPAIGLGVLLGGVILGAGNWVNNKPKEISYAERYASIDSGYYESLDSINAAIQLNNKRRDGEKLTTEESAALQKTLVSLDAAGLFDSIETSAGIVSYDLKQLAGDANLAAEALRNVAEYTSGRKNHAKAQVAQQAIQAAEMSAEKYHTDKAKYDNSGLGAYINNDKERAIIVEILDAASAAYSTDSTFSPDAITSIMDFVRNLADAGALDQVLVQNQQGDLIPFSNMKNEDGSYSDADILNMSKGLIGIEGQVDQPLMRKTLYEYANNPSNMALYHPEFQSYGEYIRPHIEAYVDGKLTPKTVPYRDIIINGLVQDATRIDKDQNDETKDPSKIVTLGEHVENIFGSDYRVETYARNKNTSEYNRIKTTTPLVEDSPIAKLSKSSSNALAAQEEADYSKTFAGAYNALNATTGSPAARIASFANSFTRTNDWQKIMEDEDNIDLAKAWSAMTTIDEKGNYVAKSNVSEAEVEAFERLFAEKANRSSLIGGYVSGTEKVVEAESVLNALTSLSSAATRNLKWQNLYGVDEANQFAQQALIEIIGEELANKIINDPSDDQAKTYAEYLIEREKTLSSVDPGQYSEEIKDAITGLTGTYSEQIGQYNSFIGDYLSYEEAQRSFASMRRGKLSEENISSVSGYLGMSEDQFMAIWNSAGGQSQVDKMIKAKRDELDEVLSKAIENMIPDSELSLGKKVDTDGLKEILISRGYEWAAQIVDMLDISFDGEKIVVDATDLATETANSAYEATIGRLNADGAVPSEYSRMAETLNKASEWNKYYKPDSDNLEEQRVFHAYSGKDFEEIPQYAKNVILGNIAKNLYPGASEAEINKMFKNESIALQLSDYFEGNIDRNQLIDNIKQEQYQYSEPEYKRQERLMNRFIVRDPSTGEIDYAETQKTLMDAYDSPLAVDRNAAQGFAEFSQESGFYDAIMSYDATAESAKRCDNAVKELNKQWNDSKNAELNRYSKHADKITKALRDIESGGQDAANALADINNEVNNTADFGDAINRYKNGDRSKPVLNMLQSNSQFDADYLKKIKVGTPEFEFVTDNLEQSLTGEIEEVEEIIDNVILTDINNMIASKEAEQPGIQFDLPTIAANCNYDISAVIKALRDMGVGISNEVISLSNSLSSLGFGLEAIIDENGQFKLVSNASGIKSSGSYRGGSGGGGSKKSKADKLVEKIGHGQDLYEHQIKMIQYEQTRYENADELGNYGKMLKEEIAIEKAYLPVLESNIAALKSELKTVDEGTEDWYKIRDAILEAEEQYKDISNTIDENTDKLKENEQAILKLHTDLENIIVEEIEFRKEKEKDMLDGSVSMQDIVLNAIKQRYQDEWDLIKEDIEKKKEALEEEKNLIDDRLDARKDAEDEAAKYEELAELKRQLSLISMDSTRTKDAAALRESIAEIEKELGWDIAEREAENEKEAIDDQIDAYDDYITHGDEDLNDLLSDANNFAAEVNGVMQLNQEELFNWLKQNVKEYANSLEDAQKQIVKSWEATYKQMLGITDTYWDEVNKILSSKDAFLEYMKQSDQYLYASDDERKQLLYQWEEAYNAWLAAKKNDANYSHNDSGLGNWSGSEYTGGSSSSSSSGGSSSGGSSSSSNDNRTGYQVYVNKTKAGAAGTKSEAIALVKRYLENGYYQDSDIIKILDPDGNIVYKTTGTAAFDDTKLSDSGSSSSSGGGSGSLPSTGWPSLPRGSGYYGKRTKNNKNVSGSLVGPFPTRDAAVSKVTSSLGPGENYQTKYFETGGIADFTGFAWLDGTPEKPERILNAEQTESFDELVGIMDDLRGSGITASLLRDMANWSTFVKSPMHLNNISNDSFKGNIVNVGDVHVELNEAQINDDRDYDEIAQLVGQKFVKELSKQGVGIASYVF